MSISREPLTVEDIEQLPRRIRGKILHINKDTEKGGWGFIQSKEIPFQRIFFHWTYVQTPPFLELSKGDDVEFTPEEDLGNDENPGKGWRAIRVVGVRDAS